jgi:Dolichyl-phosphate-mannose-protein mannosyltransferase
MPAPTSRKPKLATAPADDRDRLAWLDRAPEWLIVPALLFAALLALDASAFLTPFMADDFVFLDHTRHARFLDLLSPADAIFGYFRPWSRELHYWWLQHVFGLHELPFHLVSFALWITALAFYHAIARRVAGPRAAGVATAAVAVLAAWGSVLHWIAGVQDLWMLAWALASLWLLARDRPYWSAAAFAGALLSKETGVVVLPIAVAYLLIVERRPPLATLRRVGAHVAIAIPWALVHPQLGGRWWTGHAAGAAGASTTSGAHADPVTILWRTLLATINLPDATTPKGGWGAVLTDSLMAIVVVALLVARGARAARRNREPRRAASAAPPVTAGTPTAPLPPERVALFGSVWALLGWLPLFSPSIGWHAYYGAIGMLGAWLALAPPLARDPRRAVPALALLTVLGVAHARTPSFDWGDLWFQTRAAKVVTITHTYLRQTVPTLPRHSRVFFANVPVGSGLLPGADPPLLRLWYGDSTLQAHFVSDFEPRPAGAPAGPDYFFAYDSTAGWKQEDLRTTLPAAPTADEREQYGSSLWNLGRFAQAARILRSLAAESTRRVDYTFNVGSCFVQMGDSAEAARWYWRAAQLPGAPEGVLRPANRLSRFLRAGEKDSLAKGLVPIDTTAAIVDPRQGRRP